MVKPPRRGASSAIQDRLKQASIRDEEPERPSYSKSYLDELRNSTPSTPRDLSLTTTPDPDEQRMVDIESKFGKPSPLSNSTSIPSATEIAERKARRARLALEQSAATNDPESEDFIPLEAYDSDGEFKPTRMQVGTYVSDNHSSNDKNTRLVPKMKTSRKASKNSSTTTPTPAAA